ncbi:hypothetical protein [Pseudomonas batumici]|uniref:hypothetical protein n=1 Tax=Pseudomonas batumici TaxID=226910 RepID=UPI000589EA38|nr:hypothetical protein [Pseudomonas batumici]
MLRYEAEALEKRIPGEFFSLSEIVRTYGVEALVQNLLDVEIYLDRHLCGDWRELPGAAKKLWIITSAHRSVTFLFLPIEPTLPQYDCGSPHLRTCTMQVNTWASRDSCSRSKQFNT